MATRVISLRVDRILVFCSDNADSSRGGLGLHSVDNSNNVSRNFYTIGAILDVSTYT